MTTTEMDEKFELEKRMVEFMNEHNLESISMDGITIRANIYRYPWSLFFAQPPLSHERSQPDYPGFGSNGTLSPGYVHSDVTKIDPTK